MLTLALRAQLTRESKRNTKTCRPDYRDNTSSLKLEQANIELANPAKVRSSMEMVYRAVYECGHEETQTIPMPAKW